MACKLVGAVKGTKLWAGDWPDSAELRGAAAAPKHAAIVTRASAGRNSPRHETIKVGCRLTGRRVELWTSEDDKRLRKLADEGRTVSTIPERLKRSPHSVRYRAMLKKTLTRVKGMSPPANDDKSPLIDLISCVVCNQTMRLEKSSPDTEGTDMIQYRCRQCNRIELVRLLRRSRDSTTEG